MKRKLTPSLRRLLRLVRSILPTLALVALTHCADQDLEPQPEDTSLTEVAGSEIKKAKFKTGLTVTTSQVTDISPTGAAAGGSVTSDKNWEVSERGIYWGTSPNPETTGTKLQLGEGDGSFSTTLSGLSPNTSYFVVAYAINKKGIAYGQAATFTTTGVAYGSFTDPRDGRIYKTIEIGNQIWMAENLRFDAGNGRYCYDDQAANCDEYGSLYTWNEALHSVPPGWHLPSKAEFEALINHLGSEAYSLLLDGGASGFNSLFAGFRNTDDTYIYQGQYADYWSATEEDGNTDWVWIMDLNVIDQKAQLGTDRKIRAFSIRCIKNTTTAAVPTSGLMLHMPFNGNADDLSGNNNHGTVHGAALTPDRFGNVNRAFEFDGMSNYILVNNSPHFPSTAITTAFWLNRQSNPPGPGSGENYINKELSFSSYLYNSGELVSQVWRGVPGSWTSWDDGNYVLPQNDNWLFYASTFDNNTKLVKIYINGVLVNTINETDANAVVRTASTSLYIGRNGSSPVYFIRGKLDDIRLYNRALSDAEIAALYHEQ